MVGVVSVALMYVDITPTDGQLQLPSARRVVMVKVAAAAAAVAAAAAATAAQRRQRRGCRTAVLSSLYASYYLDGIFK